jgi:hypothetical protein
MERMRRRLDLCFVCLALGFLALVGCDDPTPAGTRYISFVEPLQMNWAWKDQGAPYSGGDATFSAQTALRVVWRFRIDGYPRLPDGRHPRYVQTFQNQDRIAFTWHGNASGSDPFAPGDSCVATVQFNQLDPAETDRSRFVFLIAH